MATEALREAMRRAGHRGVGFLAFQQRYFNDPVGFARDCVTWKPGQGLAPYQEDALNLIVLNDRASVRGPHGLGKTTTMALAILWFTLTRDGLDWKCPTTASNWRQLTKYLWPEVHKWARRLRWDVIGRGPFIEGKELMDFGIKLSTGQAFAVASDQAAAIEGAHADHIFYVLDEAKEIPADLWDSVEGAMSTGDARILAVSTPGPSSGRFYEIQSRAPAYSNWEAMRVTLAMAVSAGRVSQEWADNLKRSWGENSAAYQRHVLGEFAEDDTEAMIPLTWVEEAQERWRLWNEAGRPGTHICLATDVGAGTGGDKTTQADYWEIDLPEEKDVEGQRAYDELPYHAIIGSVRANNNEDTMETVGRIVAWLERHGGKSVVDIIGVGTGVVHRLRELDVEVEGFNASEHTTMRDRTEEMGYANLRAAAWGYLRDMLNPMNDERLALPPNPLLTGDLTAVHTRAMSGGKLRIEEKDKIRERIGRSTDDGDAVVMAVFGAHLTGKRSWLIS